MGPGDLLYLPRGQFHDALASSAASLHVTFSCTQPTGLDLLSRLWDGAVADPLFRAYLPTEQGAREQRVAELMEHLRAMALQPEGLAQAQALQESFAIKHGSYDLPHMGPPQQAPAWQDGAPFMHPRKTGS